MGTEIDSSLEIERLKDENAALRAALAGKMGQPKGWLITGSRMYQDTVASTEGGADRRIAERGKNDRSRKLPLFSMPEMPS